MANPEDIKKLRGLQNYMPFSVVPDGYGQERQNTINNNIASGKTYSYGGKMYGDYAPGTKTKARKDYEAAEKKAKELAAQKSMLKLPVASSGINTGAAPAASGANGTIKQWLQEALSLTGQDQGLLPYLETMAMKESGGDPLAINEWDANWKAGTPSKGILQTIDSTFQAHKLPGHDDIWNPVDNAAAAIRYAIARYGSLENVPGVKAMANGGNYVGY